MSTIIKVRNKQGKLLIELDIWLLVEHMSTYCSTVGTFAFDFDRTASTIEIDGIEIPKSLSKDDPT
jgi:hypothetical protein